MFFFSLFFARTGGSFLVFFFLFKAIGVDLCRFPRRDGSHVYQEEKDSEVVGFIWFPSGHKDPPGEKRRRRERERERRKMVGKKRGAFLLPLFGCCSSRSNPSTVRESVHPSSTDNSVRLPIHQTVSLRKTSGWIHATRVPCTRWPI